MPVQYTIYQDKRKNGSKLFYGRAVQVNTVKFKEVCDMVQANTTAKTADVVCVLTEFIEKMQFFLQNGYKVEWEGIGTFYITGKSMGAISLDLASSKQMHSPRLAFIAKWERQDGVQTRAFTEGVSFKKMR